jgi:hypothetical protein
MGELKPLVIKLMSHVKAILASAEKHNPKCQERERQISVAMCILECLPYPYDEEGDPIVEPYEDYSDQYWERAGDLHVLMNWELLQEDQSLEAPCATLQ